ncbi:hypothetical protein [Enterobacter mori]
MNNADTTTALALKVRKAIIKILSDEERTAVFCWMKLYGWPCK